MATAIRANASRSGEFEVGATDHPWEVDAMPLFASSTLARAAGFVDRPIHPLAALHRALMLSARDARDPAGARLELVDVRFPQAGFAGDTLSARSQVIPDGGGAIVRTLVHNDRGHVLCAVERRTARSVELLSSNAAIDLGELRHLAPQLGGADNWQRGQRQFARTFGDFDVGDVYLHEGRKTVGEHLLRAHQIANDGLVLAWVLALASRDVAGNALWDLGLTSGAVSGSVAADDTIHAASKVVSVRDAGAFGAVTFRVVGVKNRTATSAWEEHGEALFGDVPVGERVVEVTHTLAIRKR